MYEAERSGVHQLYLRPIDQAEGKPIPGTENGVCPFFSPDGKWVGFIGPAGLTKVPIGGGAPVVLCQAFPRGASWGQDDTIVFPTSNTSGLWNISAAGGTPQVLTTLDSTNREKSHLWPEILPGGKAVIFAAITRLGFLETDNPVDADIVVQSLETGKRQVVIPGASYARYVPTGHLVYARAGTLMAVPFDLAGLRVTGPPVPVVEGVMEATLTGARSSPSPASDGWCMYREVLWKRRAGSSGSIERERSSPWKRLRAPISGPGSQPMAAAWRLPSAGALPMCGFATCRGTPGIRLPPTDIASFRSGRPIALAWRFLRREEESRTCSGRVPTGAAPPSC